jgi:integrase
MADRQKEVRDGKIFGVVAKPFGQVAADYLGCKRAKRKRTVDKDAEILTKRLVPFFGAETPACEITAQRIADYERHRATEVHRQLKRPIAPATINRHLGVLQCLLRLAKKWGFCRDVLHIEIGREPDGRLRYLGRDEAARLPAACRLSKNPHLHAIVTIALHTGMPKREILGLAWERVDFARGVPLVPQGARKYFRPCFARCPASERWPVSTNAAQTTR